MKLEGEYRLDADVKDVWAALFDPAILAAVVPGCEKLALVDGVYVGGIMIKVGPIQGKFTGRVELKGIHEPESYKIVVDGHGTPGFAANRCRTPGDPYVVGIPRSRTGTPAWPPATR
jgi:carbon monoxide dehydrogenase subunit G